MKKIIAKIILWTFGTVLVLSVIAVIPMMIKDLLSTSWQSILVACIMMACFVGLFKLLQWAVNEVNK